MYFEMQFDRTYRTYYESNMLHGNVQMYAGYVHA